MKPFFSKLQSLFGLALASLHGWPLILRIPHTLWALWQVFRPGGLGIKDLDFWAFGRRDAIFRPWYNKLARDFQTQGRTGYAWEDGLGLSLSARIYNNLATYTLLRWLGTRRMMALGYLLLVGAVVWAVISGFGPWIGLLAALLSAASPLIVSFYTHTGKPESFWWGPALAFIWLAFTGPGLLAGLVWSLLAFTNVACSVLIALLLAPALLVLSLSNSPAAFLGLAVGVLPGVVKLVFRFTHMFRTGFAGSLVGEQTRLSEQPWFPTSDELAWWLPFTASILASTFQSGLVLAGIFLLVVPVGLNYLNNRQLKINDRQSFNLALWIIGLAFASMTGSLLGLLFLLLMAYNNPVLSLFPFASIHGTDLRLIKQQAIRSSWRVVKRYPDLRALSLPASAALMDFFNRIPDGARILSEARGDPRTESGFYGFWLWTEEFLPSRQIDHICEAYTQLAEPALVQHYLNRFTAGQMAGAEMAGLCQALGVSHVVAYTEATSAVLEEAGFRVRGSLDLACLPDFCCLLSVPVARLVLLENPVPVTVIHPQVAWVRVGNSLCWEASAGQTYIVRYRYTPQFQAIQGSQVLEINPLQPIAGNPLAFMQVTAVTDGAISVEFQPRWF